MRQGAYPKHSSRGDTRTSRRGAAAVEFAVVAPLIFFLLFVGIEFGRVLMAFHGLDAAARQGCRVAVAWDATQKDVEQTVADSLSVFGIPNYDLTTEPRRIASARQWESVTVRIKATYGQVSWLPSPQFLKRITLTGSCTLPEESDPDNS